MRNDLFDQLPRSQKLKALKYRKLNRRAKLTAEQEAAKEAKREAARTRKTKKQLGIITPKIIKTKPKL